MNIIRRLAIAILLLGAAACSGSNEVNPPVLRGIDGLEGWKRTGEVERYNKEALYGYIDGGAEIVLQYGFRELAVSRYVPAAGAGSSEEIVLEIYRMASAEAAFGLYSIRLEGGEKGRPEIKVDHWVGQGQASLVKGDYYVNVLAPGSDEAGIGGFLAQVERRVPGKGTARPKGLSWLPREGMVPSSWHFVKGPLAAQNESPLLDGEFWGFAAVEDGKKSTRAYSAKYSVLPAVSKFVVVELAEGVAGGTVDAGVQALFGEYLKGVRLDGGIIRGQNEAGRWFLYKRSGAIAVLVLGDPDETSALARLNAALGLAAWPFDSPSE